MCSVSAALCFVDMMLLSEFIGCKEQSPTYKHSGYRWMDRKVLFRYRKVGNILRPVCQLKKRVWRKVKLGWL